MTGHTVLRLGSRAADGVTHAATATAGATAGVMDGAVAGSGATSTAAAQQEEAAVWRPAGGAQQL